MINITVGARLLAVFLSAAIGGSTVEDPELRVVSSNASADTVGSITGRIVEAGTQRGIAAGQVILLPPDRSTFTAPDGAFAFHDVPAGDYELVVEHLGYRTDSAEVTVRAGETASVEVTLLAQPHQLEPLDVTVRRAYLDAVGFYDRQEEGWGEYLTPEKLERVGLRNYVRFRPEILLRITGFPGERLMRTKNCGDPAYYLDGRRKPPTGLISEMSAHEIGAVEVYPEGHGLPLFALDPTAMKCGAVVVWTKRW